MSAVPTAVGIAHEVADTNTDAAPVDRVTRAADDANATANSIEGLLGTD